MNIFDRVGMDFAIKSLIFTAIVGLFSGVGVIMAGVGLFFMVPGFWMVEVVSGFLAVGLVVATLWILYGDD